jgi:hypothetical protein
MRDLERLLQAAAPAAPTAPAELEDRIWTALGYEDASTFEVDGPLLVVDDGPPSPSRRPSRLSLVFGVVGVAAALAAAVIAVGLHGRSGSPAAQPPATRPLRMLDPAAAIGRTYAESLCPDLDRGACFEPFTAGRYTFHKTNPQLTLTVGDGWTNDWTWPTDTSLSRGDSPGATLRLLDDAHQPAASSCDADAAPDLPHTAADLATHLAASPGLITTTPARTHLGELAGYVLDVAVGDGARTVACGDGTRGVPVLSAPASDANADHSWLLTLGRGDRARIVVADASNGRTIAVAAVVTGDAADLARWMAKAQPVVDTISFRPCAQGHVFSQPCEFPPSDALP